MERNFVIIIIFLLIINIINCSSRKIPDFDQNGIENNHLLEEERKITGNIKNYFNHQVSEIFPEEGFFDSSFYTLNFWGERDYNIKTWILIFYKDRYIFRPTEEGDPPYIEGSYEIIDNKIILNYIGIPYGSYEHLFDNILMENWVLEYTAINDSIYFTEGLIGKNIIFARNDSKPQDGESRTINGYEILIKKIDHLRINSNVEVRIGPGEQYQICTFEWRGEEGWDKMNSVTDYLIEEAVIYTIGHSKNRDTFNGLTGFWYYCWIPVWKDLGGKIIKPLEVKNNSGWIFGPLIGLK